MSFLNRLKAKLTGLPLTPSEGSGGEPDRHVLPNECDLAGSEGFEGGLGGLVSPANGLSELTDPVSLSKNKQTSIKICSVPSKEGGVSPRSSEETHLPQAPSEPSKGQNEAKPGRSDRVDARYQSGRTGITSDDVRAGVEREIRDLAAHGRTGPEAVRDAIAITRAKIRNSPLLVEAQTGASQCFVCNDPEDPDRPFIPVLSGARGRLHWMHLGCHGEHSRRLAAKVDATMSAAGFGEAEEMGDAA